MQYDLKNELSRKAFIARVRHLLETGQYVELTDKRLRTLNQNAYCHMAIGMLAIDTGNSVETIKREIFKKRVNPDIFLVEKEDERLGHIETIRSTRKVSKEEMSTAIERFRQFCSSVGCYIPEPGELDEIAQAEYQISREAKYYTD